MKTKPNLYYCNQHEGLVYDTDSPPRKVGDKTVCLVCVRKLSAGLIAPKLSFDD